MTVEPAVFVGNERAYGVDGDTMPGNVDEIEGPVGGDTL